MPRTESAEQEKQNDSADATPLKVVNSTVPPNEFVKIAKRWARQWSISTPRPCPSSRKNQGRRNFHGRIQPNPQNPGDEDQDEDHRQQQGQGNLQDFLNRFFGGQMPDMQGG